jgi:hypothetical protein
MLGALTGLICLRAGKDGRQMLHSRTDPTKQPIEAYLLLRNHDTK